jgi:hypothetical protein
MSKIQIEDPINPKLAPVCAWFSGAFIMLGVAKPELIPFAIIFSTVFGSLSYLAYRLRRYSPI